MSQCLPIASMLLVVFVAGCVEPARQPVTQPAEGPRDRTTARPEDRASSREGEAPAEPAQQELRPPDRGSSPVVAPPQTQPSPPGGGQVEAVTPQPSPTAKAETATPKLSLPPPRRPARPEDSWAIFREAFDEQQDAACTARWTGGNRLEVTTQNVKRLTIDLTLLPEGAPQKGPWILQIDGQGVELTGFTPRPGYTGRIRDLVRSQNGAWSVDRKALYRIRG